MYSKTKIKNATLSDLNSELINLYVTVKINLGGLIKEMVKLRFQNNSEFCYKLREEFNAIIGNEEKKVERAAMFLYLNRLCYNGLWRVNSSGKFNFPFGKYTKPSIV